MEVTTTTLEMLSAPTEPARAFPPDARLDRAPVVSPEYARFLYGLIGGPRYWTERLGWSRQQWVDELAMTGTEFLILYSGGVPLGYVHLHPIQKQEGTHVEIRYFGLAEEAIGRGLGGRLLEHGIQAAWSLSERFNVPAVVRVWVHMSAGTDLATVARCRSDSETCSAADFGTDPVLETVAIYPHGVYGGSPARP